MMNPGSQLAAESSDEKISIYRRGQHAPILVQHAVRNKRPFIHPLLAPDGLGVLTENAPAHHPWQHGIFTGLHNVNGVEFWEEGMRGHPQDGSFQPRPLMPAVISGNQAAWFVETSWCAPDGTTMMIEIQRWHLRDEGESYLLDLEWRLQAETSLHFGKHRYGGLFLRMPYRQETGGEALNSEGELNGEAEGRSARWASVSMPIEGRPDWAGIAILDHQLNPEHPTPWRIDRKLGISPSRCISREWFLPKHRIQAFHYRLFVFCGKTEADEVEKRWQSFVNEIVMD